MWCGHCRSIWPHKVHKDFILSIFHLLVGGFGVDVDKLTAVELNMKETENFPNDPSNVFCFFPLTSKISCLSCLCKGEKLFRSCVCFAALIWFPPPLHSKHLQLDPVAAEMREGHPSSTWALWALSFCIEFLPQSQKSLLFQLWKGGQWGTENMSNSGGCISLSELCKGFEFKDLPCLDIAADSQDPGCFAEAEVQKQLLNTKNENEIKLNAVWVEGR